MTRQKARFLRSLAVKLRGMARAACLLCGLAAIAGCAAATYDDADKEYFRNQPERVLEAYARALEDRGRNALLGVDKLLSAAMLRHDWAGAEQLAIRASTLVNIFVAGEKGERDALSLLGQEKDKPFKGEPHERVMVDFYLGIIRFRRGDYEGALAAFRSARNKDRGAYLLPVEEDKAAEGKTNLERFLYDPDYALLDFFAAKCHQLLGEPQEAEEYLASAHKIRPELGQLFDEGMDPETNIFVVVEGGRPPLKRKTGPKGAILAYRKDLESRLDRVSFDGQDLSFGLCEDLYFQATTLGGRHVDDLNLVKVRRQEVLQAAGFATMTAGYALALAGAAGDHHHTSRNLQYAGLAAMAVGLGAMIFADAAIDPSADVRAWTTLPGEVYLAVGRAQPGGSHRLKVSAECVGDESQEWIDVPVEEGVNLYPIRLLPGRSGGSWLEEAAPPPDGSAPAGAAAPPAAPSSQPEP